jgi:hypothetical protein
MPMLGSIIIVWLWATGADSIPLLPNGTTVRVQSPELIPGWHIGKLEITQEGCAMVWMSSSEVPGGRKGLGLMFLAKLERQEGDAWIDVPVKPLMEKQPKSCQEGAG